MTAITAFFERSDVHDEVKPYAWDGPAMDALPQSNFVMKERELNLTDVRTVPDFQPTIQDNGFCFLQNPSKELSNLTGRDDCKPYLEEQAQFLKKRFGTDEVWAINANFRDSRSSGGRTGHLLFAHLDNTVNSSWERISLFLTEEERERVLSGRARARIINIWRPMVNHAEDIPFAVCDPKTNTDLGDVVAVDRITPQAAKELAYFAWNPEHRWYWLSNQTPDEVVIMTQYDTHPPGGMFNIVPHAAFRNGAARAGCPPRQSVEARFIVLEPAPYEKDGPGPAGPFPEDPRKQPWKDFVNPPKPEPAPAPTADNRPMYF
ncbi:Hydroxylase/desaturase asaB [Colletotrichum trifolii]|uniref:Hydroxylase/desaturase asaB n=1 Tax=Colletotrichum trifolii TaxID=5466 RepID=A0A4R8RKK6_COLTR|nr:Hydroxylase/desaturase asaB [Colletotrichum trifolii]